MKAKYFLLIAVFPILFYSSQGLLIRAKLSAIDSDKISLSSKDPDCSRTICTYTYTYKSNKKFLLAGHIIRSHRVLDSNGQEIFPANRQKGNEQDTWINLNIYRTPIGTNISIVASHPRIAKIGPIAGIHPRETNDREVFSIPDISPTISIATQIFSIILLIVLFSAAAIANRETPKYLFEQTAYLSIITAICLLSMGFNSHFFDSLFASSEARELLLRGFALTGIGLPAIQYFRAKNNRIWFIFLGLVATQFTSAYFGRVIVFDHSLYSIAIVSTSLISFAVTFLQKHWYSTAMVGFFFFDAFRIIGYPIPDHPPIYWSQITLSAFALGVAWRQGASDLIPLAKRAYEHIRRDIELLKLSDSIRRPMESSAALSEVFRDAITKISAIAACERCSLLVFLPNENAVTFSYARDKNELREFNDGKVVGQIFTRSLLYGESFWFESLDSLNTKHFKDFAPASQHSDAKYFCALPIKHNNQVLAVLSCTKFNDKKLEGPGSDITRQELRQKIKMISREFEAGLSRRLVAGNDLMRNRQKTLQLGIKQSILDHETVSAFLQAICDRLHGASGLRVLLYKREGVKGLLVNHSGLGEHAKRWTEKPLNLDPNTGNKLGPAIVAFNEEKSSYVRDVREIYEHMHPRTIALWEEMEAEEAMTAPVQLGDDQYVLLTFSIRGNSPPDSYWLPAFENTRSFLNSAYMLVEQKSSLAALGKMSARLIGDEVIRDQVMTSAMKGEIPTVIGRDLTSLILVFDLEGSTNLEDDGEEKARAYGTFYDKLTSLCFESIGGSVRKTMGDGVIVTAKIPQKDKLQFLQDIVDVASKAEAIGKLVGGTGTRLAIHHGKYFLGLVGTKTSGTPDIIGRNIDAVCKLESKMKYYYGNASPKIAITSPALEVLVSSDVSPSYDRDSKIGKFLMFSTPKDFLDFCTMHSLKERSA